MRKIKKESRSYKRFPKYDNWTNSHLNTTPWLWSFLCAFQMAYKLWSYPRYVYKCSLALRTLYCVRHMFSLLLYLFRISSGHARTFNVSLIRFSKIIYSYLVSFHLTFSIQYIYTHSENIQHNIHFRRVRVFKINTRVYLTVNRCCEKYAKCSLVL